MTFPQKEIYNKNFGLYAKNGFSGIRWHIGTSVNWSRGCMIVGSKYIETKVRVNVYGDQNKDLIVHAFDGNDSLLKAEELSLFACCVQCKLGKTPTVEFQYRTE